MTRRYLILLSLITIFSCSKKHLSSTTAKNGATIKANAAPHRPLPKMLDVPDKIAMKSIDGRLYYDIEGHRYWKNYVNGKYYLFDKSMYNDPAFKPH
jgi:hypothetical protein